MSSATQNEDVLNRRLAELVGWTEIGNGANYDTQWNTYGLPPGMKGSIRRPIPNYTRDLNAVAEIEEALTDEEHEDYRRRLYTLVRPEYERLYDSQHALKHERAYVSASALQRTEALIKTLEGGKP